MYYLGRTPTVYYWKGKPNFGDRLMPLLLDKFCGLASEWAPAPLADFVGVGSVLQSLPAQYPGIIAGSGALFDKPIALPNAHILGVRGPLTFANLQANRNTDVVLGDPGLLASDLVNPEKEHNLGLVPHWSDDQLTTRREFLKYDPLIINPADDPAKVIEQIGSCRKIVSSSLHGLIVADAFGIPRRTEWATRFDREGGTFKFRDYNATVGVDFEIGLTQEAKRYMVTARQHEVYDMIRDLGMRLQGRAL